MTSGSVEHRPRSARVVHAVGIDSAVEHGREALIDVNVSAEVDVDTVIEEDLLKGLLPGGVGRRADTGVLCWRHRVSKSAKKYLKEV